MTQQRPALGTDRPLVECHALADELRRFAALRDWDRFHSPKNLSMALAGEVGELLEVFQWLTEQQSIDLPSGDRTAASLELADVVIYAVRLADVLGVDLNDAVARKLQINRDRYPADRVRGSARKYTDCEGNS